METFKKISILSIVGLSLCGVSNLAMAQPASPGLSAEQATSDQSDHVVNATLVKRMSKPAPKPIVNRVGEPLPEQSAQLKPVLNNTQYGRVIYSRTSNKSATRKFVYNNASQTTQTPVYFDDAALHAK